MFGQRQCAVIRPTRDNPVQAATGAECSRSPGVSDQSTIPHSSVLRGLHWLPVRQRAAFKVLLLSCKGTTWLGTSVPGGPTVLAPIRSLRSSDSLLLTVPRRRLRIWVTDPLLCGAVAVEHPASCYLCFHHLEHFEKKVLKLNLSFLV